MHANKTTIDAVRSELSKSLVYVFVPVCKCVSQKVLAFIESALKQDTGQIPSPKARIRSALAGPRGHEYSARVSESLQDHYTLRNFSVRPPWSNASGGCVTSRRGVVHTAPGEHRAPHGFEGQEEESLPGRSGAQD